jgi:uncharacterized protein (DUF1330 family)
MSAFVISEVEILDSELGARYRDLAAASIARHGGRYLVRAAEAEVAEGEFPRERRVVVVEFPSMERLREWYGSDDYAEALELSRSALRRRLIFVEGHIPA